MHLTPSDIEDRLEEAALTLRRLPHPPGTGPKGYGNSWPEHVREARHAYGYHEARMRVVPNAREIGRMEEAIGWLLLVSDPDDRRILWMRADGYAWKHIFSKIGVSRTTAWQRWVAGLVTISKALKVNGNNTSKIAGCRNAK
jgi:hypothetical protein